MCRRGLVGSRFETGRAVECLALRSKRRPRKHVPPRVLPLPLSSPTPDPASFQLPTRLPALPHPTHSPTMDAFTFGGKYRLEEEIAIGGCGPSFSPFLLPSSPSLPPSPPFLSPGTVFQGVHTVAGKEVAIKLEPAIAKSSPLKQESKIYKTLMGGPGVPWINWSGKQGDYNVMVIDLLGPSLEDLFRMCNRHFSLNTILMLADHLVSLSPSTVPHSSIHPSPPPPNALTRLSVSQRPKVHSTKSAIYDAPLSLIK